MQISESRGRVVISIPSMQTTAFPIYHLPLPDSDLICHGMQLKHQNSNIIKTYHLFGIILAAMFRAVNWDSSLEISLAVK